MDTSDPDRDAPRRTDGGEVGGLRIGDTERMEALQSLSRHFTEGRLDQDEFDERSSAVYSARSRADLTPLFFDLPELAHRDPGLHAAHDATARSERAPVRVSGDPSGAAPHGDVESRRRRRNATILTVAPVVALIVFLGLGFLVGFHISWVVWLVLPVVRTLLRASEDENGPAKGS